MKVYVENRANILTDILPFLDVTTNMLEAKAYITWNDLVEPQVQNIKEAKILGIPVIVIEHGMKAVSDYQSNLNATNEGMGKRTFTADYFFVWGNESKRILLEANVPESKVKIIGSPVIWENEYHYKNGEDIVKAAYYQGANVTDPKIAMGGVGNYEHIVNGLILSDGVAVGNLFHFKEIAAKQAKRLAKEKNINVRGF